LAVANVNDSNVAVLLNNGSGGFGTATFIGVPFSSYALIGWIELADFDGDGDQDMAVSNDHWSAQTVAVFRNNGDATFAPPVFYAAGPARPIVALDADCDGYMDLALAATHANQVWIMLNQSGPPVSQDCNRNLTPDECDIATSTSADTNHNGVPDECERVRGDADCSGAVNFDDINPFVVALVGRAVYEAEYPACLWLNSDCNADDRVNFDDINPFVACLVAGGCP
jgi:hypothetical protein